MGRFAKPILARLLALGLLTGLLEAMASASEPEDPTPVRRYWPTENWKHAAPEGYGIDTNRLAEALRQLPKACPEVGGLLLVRHGYLVVEKYFNGRSEHDYWNIKSASKSILSALVGIALEKGLIRSLDQPAIDFFPEYKGSLNDPRKSQITVRHLLTMTAGLEWVENGPISRKWMRSEDRVGFTWKSKLEKDPGTEWNYSTALTHVLSVLLTRATGTNTLDFAKTTLLDKLGVLVNGWDKDPQGYYWGGSEVYLTPRNMARFGFLYLNEGRWEGQQLVSSSWVRLTTGQTNSAHYGFLWWLDRFEERPMYFAQGLGGQHIVIVPELDLVVVTTSDIAEHNSALGFIKLAVLPCVEPLNQTEKKLPSAAEIIDRYYGAIGGRKALERLRSLRIEGTLESAAIGEHGTFEMLKGGAGRIYCDLAYTRKADRKFGSDGRVGWTTFPRGYRVLRPEYLEHWRAEAANWTDLRLPKDAKTIGLTEFDGRPCYKLRSTSSSGIVQTDFFEIQTGLLAGSIRGENWFPYGLQAFTRTFDSYQLFGEFQFPVKTVVHVQGPEEVLRRTTVEYDTLSSSAFELPIPIREILRGKREAGR